MQNSFLYFSRNGKNKGFSLVELMVTIVFLTIIVLGMVGLQTGGLRLASTQNKAFQANLLANQGAEIAEALGGSLCVPAPTCMQYITGPPYSLSGTKEPLIDGLFERRIEVSDDGLSGAKLVTVFVNWTDSAGEHEGKAKRIVYSGS